MSHLPNKLDIKTDLRRSIVASFSPNKFKDINFITFIDKAQANLELLKKNIGEQKYTEVKERIIKANDTKKSIEKRREDILTAASLI